MNRTESIWQQTEKAAQIYKLLDNTHRLMILSVLLEHSELCVGQLNQHIDLPAVPLSQHLKLLRDQGWVMTRKQGHRVFYRIANPNLGILIALTKQLYCPHNIE